jgi:1,4-dihydroxy-6-naphthoate synthase
MQTLALGYSPCPNDTFIFYALVHGRVDCSFGSIIERLEDVETLNRLALAKTLDISKVSYHLLGHIRDEYCLLRSGGALGRGCGPLLVAREPVALEDLAGRPVAIPGRYTTAALLLRLAAPWLDTLVEMPFHEIMGKVARGEVAAGAIIHESRFTYADYGLVRLMDLGAWWEEETGQPIPLGGIVARRSLGKHTISAIDAALKASVAYGFAHRSEAHGYIRSHSQEMSAKVCDAHIDLYVNNFSLDLGSAGETAVTTLLSRGEAIGLFPHSPLPLFIS